MSLLRLTGVTKRYPGMAAPAVDDLSLSVAAGEILALLGPSGCGKTTTLRLVAGFETPDAGLIEIRGETVAGPGRAAPPEARGIGVVFQDYALFPHLTVAANVSFGLADQARAAQATRVRAILDLVGLTGLERRYPHELSGGQQQRVALARALAPSPALILLDEPFSNLDADLRAAMREEIGKILRATGTTARECAGPGTSLDAGGFHTGDAPRPRARGSAVGGPGNPPHPVSARAHRHRRQVAGDRDDVCGGAE